MRLKYIAIGLISIFCLSQKQIDFTKEYNISMTKNTKPNIIYILADDLGYGDLSIYGQEKFSTPNIDKLAKEGMLFRQHYAGSTVCSPSRSSLFTGLHTGYTPIRGNKEVKPEGQYPLPDSVLTISKLLKKNGYITGAFGKWGLGFPGSEGDPLNQGFDEFFGYNCQALAHHYYPYHLWKNEQKIILEKNEGKNKGQYAPNLIHQEALNFIDRFKDEPFFLYYPTVIPHAELVAPNEYMDKFVDTFLPEKAFKGNDDGEKYRKGNYESQEQPRAAFSAMVTLLDDQVGDIMKKIKELGLEENTIIIFTSDNGPHIEGGGDPDFFNSNGKFRGYKRDLYEGGIRVPMIAKWKGMIKEGASTNHVSAFWDIMPTFAEIVKDKSPLKTNGISFLPTLLGTNSQEKHEYLYWEFHENGGRQAVLKNNWKLIKNNVSANGNLELYNLSIDPSESNNLATDFPEMINELSQLLKNSRTKSDVFKNLN